MAWSTSASLTRAAKAQVQGIGQQRLVGGADVEVDREQPLRGHGGAGGVELELADRDAHAVRAQVTQAQDPPARGDTDHPDVADRPVAQHLGHPALVPDRQVHAAGTPVDVAELQARLAHRRVIQNRQEPRRIGHDHLVEQHLIGVQQPDQVDVALQIGRLVAELLQRPPDLGLLAVHPGRQQPGQAERLALGLREGRGLVTLRIVQQFDPTLRAGRVLARGHRVLLPLPWPSARRREAALQAEATRTFSV